MWAYGLPMYTQISRRDAVKKVLTHPCVHPIIRYAGADYNGHIGTEI